MRKSFKWTLLILLLLLLPLYPVQAEREGNPQDLKGGPQASGAEEPLQGFQFMNGYYFYYVDGKYVTGFYEIEDDMYYFRESGTMATGFQNIGGDWYFFEANGKMVRGERRIGEFCYYFDPKTGIRQSGWQKIDGNWRYYRYTSGTMATGRQYIGHQWYLFNEEGDQETGFQKWNGYYYYFRENSGTMATGWQYISGYWYYFRNSGTMATGSQYINGSWYYFRGSGTMATGLQYLGGSWYYYDKSGRMQTGWQHIYEADYYFRPSGTMVAGDQYIDGKWQFFHGTGPRIQGFWKKNGYYYYYGEDGQVLKGWQTINGKTYYFRQSGTLAQGFQYIDGAWRYFDTEGMARGFRRIGDHTYYFDAQGRRASGTTYIRGERHNFSSDGVCFTKQVDLKQRPLAKIRRMAPVHITKQDLPKASSQRVLKNRLLEWQTKAIWTEEKPLLLVNPYQVIHNGVYYYVSDPSLRELNYRVLASDTPAYQKDARLLRVDDQGTETMLMGAAPNIRNTFTVWTQGVQEFDFVSKPLNSEVETPVHRKTHAPTGLQGFFALIGSSLDRISEYLPLMDVNGYLRNELVLNGYRGDDIQQSKDGCIYIGYSAHEIVKMDPIGRMVRVYRPEGYYQHHDFKVDEENGRLWLLATSMEVADTRVEDQVVCMDLKTGRILKVLDFAKLMSGMYDLAKPAYSLEHKQVTLDWMHFNSIIVDGEDIWLSSRETSATIAVKNALSNPEIAYLFGTPEPYKGTRYEELLLTRQSDFVYPGGQHSLSLVSRENGKLIFSMFNNNCWAIPTRPELDKQEIIPGANKGNSYYELYEIDEDKKTVRQLKKFPVDLSRFISWVQEYPEKDIQNGLVIVNSGQASTISVMDANGKLLEKYNLNTRGMGYRTPFRSYEGYWFK